MARPKPAQITNGSRLSSSAHARTASSLHAGGRSEEKRTWGHSATVEIWALRGNPRCATNPFGRDMPTASREVTTSSSEPSSTTEA